MITLRRILEERFENYRGAKVLQHCGQLAILIPDKYGTADFFYNLGEVIAINHVKTSPSDPDRFQGLDTNQDQSMLIREIQSTNETLVIFEIDFADLKLFECSDKLDNLDRI